MEISQPSIKELLINIGAISNNNLEVFSKKTRDLDNLLVYRDSVSKVIFIDGYFVGNDIYDAGKYRNDNKSTLKSAGKDYEDLCDSVRRFEHYKQLIVGKSILDFGCGAGSFLKLAAPYAKKTLGVELQNDYRQDLNAYGISCKPNIFEVQDSQDTIFLFHCLEHLEHPLLELQVLRSKLNEHGKILIEVPHAKDFLIDKLPCKEFIDFTLWSQHLILHTRSSLELLLRAAGFKNVYIEGIQRYSLANHLTWLHDARPGGHRLSISLFETEELINSYASALAKIDATDTLVAIADAY
jgi:SAM-dependent methyltransferase